MTDSNINYENEEIEEVECAICLIAFEEDDEANKIIELKCNKNANHIYHWSCLKEWIIYQDNCPMCKSQINTIVS
jgi:hypothetical protein